MNKPHPHAKQEAVNVAVFHAHLNAPRQFTFPVTAVNRLLTPSFLWQPLFHVVPSLCCYKNKITCTLCWWGFFPNANPLFRTKQKRSTEAQSICMQSWYAKTHMIRVCATDRAGRQTEGKRKTHQTYGDSLWKMNTSHTYSLTQTHADGCAWSRESEKKNLGETQQFDTFFFLFRCRSCSLHHCSVPTKPQLVVCYMNRGFLGRIRTVAWNGAGTVSGGVYSLRSTLETNLMTSSDGGGVVLVVVVADALPTLTLPLTMRQRKPWELVLRLTDFELAAGRGFKAAMYNVVGLVLLM